MHVEAREPQGAHHSEGDELMQSFLQLIYKRFLGVDCCK